MEKKTEKIHSDKWLKDLPLRSESEGYKPEEMIACKKCQRANPPTRLDCMYCGDELEFDENQSQTIKPVLKKAEAHQNGYNLIYLANLKTWDETQLSEVAKMTRLSKNNLQNLVQSQKTLPIARSETEKDTQIVLQRLKELGIETFILKDEKFELDKISKRLRKIEFDGDKIILTLFNNNENIEMNLEDLTLIVVGAVFERKLETTEKHKKKGDNKVLETTEISSDEVLIDIYSNEDLINYRISPKGFDFSGLGDEKEVLATQNVKILIEKLKDFAGSEKFDEDYLKVRDSLTQIWETEESMNLKGMKRKSIGNYNKETVITMSNLLQFTKYSRLQRLLSSDKFLEEMK